ncbi:MAG: hypothetical protein M1838_005959 [Thelocarpon superellum]|nr:MAG: hypothetical protein M1838_005959 [Thelocarpon superellum]
MDSPLATRIFRRLFRHQYCQAAKASCRPSILSPSSSRTHRRSISNGSHQSHADPAGRESHWQQRTDILPEDKSEEYRRYPMVTADQLRSRRERPKRVKMLVRDFIDDSLYNPSYGYFSKQAVIFTPGAPFAFNEMRDEPAFHAELSSRYTAFEDALDAKTPSDTRQLWHTPTELFRPHYGEAIARYLVSNYKLSLYPYHDLIIYELGAGNGTLMLNILDYIRDTDPSVYARTQFRIIEISHALASIQSSTLTTNARSRGHLDKVQIINRSIFDWDTYVPSPCFFLALEVFDNFAHDSIRYDPTTGQPLQGSVLIDSAGDFYEFYSATLDPLAAHYLRARATAVTMPYPHPVYSTPAIFRFLRSCLPFTPNLSTPEFIPTRLLQFFEILAAYFPAHRLVSSDFHSLPDAIAGINAPVVQTRYQRRTVPVSTPFVEQGYFDILFPTPFTQIEPLYRAVTGKLTRVLSQEDFLRRWALVHDTETRSGENPMLSWYRNASVLTTL